MRRFTWLSTFPPVPGWLMVWCLVLVGVNCLAADEWPAFRGPAGDGHADTARIPLRWDESHNVTWRTAIHGVAWSSPVVSGNDVWLTTATKDGTVLSVLCVKLDSGEVRIDRKIFDVETPTDITAYNTYASPTPCHQPRPSLRKLGQRGTRQSRHLDGRDPLDSPRPAV